MCLSFKFCLLLLLTSQSRLIPKWNPRLGKNQGALGLGFIDTADPVGILIAAQVITV